MSLTSSAAARTNGSAPPATAAVAPPAVTTANQLLLARGVTVVGLAGVGLVHVLDSVDTFHETRWLFWLYMALVVGSVLVAGLVLQGHRSAWALVALVALAPLVGYVVSRTVGLPGDSDDKGNWTEPLGLASLWIEVGLLAVAGWAVALTARRGR